MAIQPTQQEEEQLVRAFFNDAASGTFVEVGANHPTKRSQTWHLEQLGWTGVLVEPQPDLAAFLVTARSAKVFAVACSSPANAEQSMPLHVDGPLSSLNRNRMAAGSEPSYVIMVPTRTLNSILDEAEAPTPIDLLSIDVEGHEIEVLRGFDFAHWQPRLLMLEDHVENLAKHRFVERNGYRLVRRVGNNGWYVPADSKLRSTPNERLAIVRKYSLALPFRKVRNASRAMRRLIKDWWAGR